MRVWNSIYANSLEDILKNENWRIKKLNSVKKTIICAQPGSYRVLPVLHGNTTILTYYWCLLPGNTTNFRLFNMKLIFSPMYALNTKLKKIFFPKIRNSVKIENNLVKMVGVLRHLPSPM